MAKAREEKDFQQSFGDVEVGHDFVAWADGNEYTKIQIADPRNPDRKKFAAMQKGGRGTIVDFFAAAKVMYDGPKMGEEPADIDRPEDASERDEEDEGNTVEDDENPEEEV